MLETGVHVSFISFERGYKSVMTNQKLHTFYEFHTSLENYQIHKFNQMLSFLMVENEYYKNKLEGIRLPIRSKKELAQLPFTTKQELVNDQKNNLPYGKNHTYPVSSYGRYHQTSGTTGEPLKVLDTPKSWNWWEECWKKVYDASHVTSEDIVFLAFSFGPFVGFWGGFEAAKKISALVISSGSQSSKERITSMMNNNATVLLCTPSYALRLIEVAEEMGADLHDTSIEKIITAGEPGGSIPSIRKQIEDGWDATVYDHVGMTEMGAYGYGCDAKNGLHINDEQFIAEIINPETGEPVGANERGELVLTNLGRYGYPLIRYRTGDMVINQPEGCTCGDSFTFLPGGLLGRADDMVVIRGINIYPSSIEAIVREYKEIKEFRIVYYTEDDMDQIKVQIETDNEAIRDELYTLLRQRVGLRINTEIVENGTLPRFEMKAKRILDDREKRTAIS